MSKLAIPELGQKLLLQNDLEVEIYLEYRNEKFLGQINPDWLLSSANRYYNSGRMPKHRVMLPAGTLLTVDRIYIRKGSSDYNSVTFSHTRTDKALRSSRLPTGRFWISLKQANELDVEFV
jgi:hypothetical protein